MLGEMVAERFVGEVLEIGHAVPGKQVDGRPLLLIELHASYEDRQVAILRPTDWTLGPI
jgi:hypothetical protein